MPNSRGGRRRRDGRSGWPKADGRRRRRGRGWRRRGRRPGRQHRHWKRHGYRLKPLGRRYRRSRSFRRGKKGGLNIVCNVRYHGNGEKPQGISGYMNPEPGQIQSRVRLLPRLRPFVVPLDGQAERIAAGGIVIPLRQPHLQGSIFRLRALPGHPVGVMQRDVERADRRGTAGRQFGQCAGRHIPELQRRHRHRHTAGQQHHHGTIRGGHRCPRKPRAIGLPRRRKERRIKRYRQPRIRGGAIRPGFGRIPAAEQEYAAGNAQSQKSDSAPQGYE